MGDYGSSVDEQLADDRAARAVAETLRQIADNEDLDASSSRHARLGVLHAATAADQAVAQFREACDTDRRLP